MCSGRLLGSRRLHNGDTLEVRQLLGAADKLDR